MELSSHSVADVRGCMLVPEPSGGHPRTPLWTLKAIQLFGTAAVACLCRFITVFYAEVGLSREQIGVIQFVSPVVNFTGQFFWANVIDRIGDYKRPLVGTTVTGSLVMFCCVLPTVQSSFCLLLLVSVVGNFFLCTAGPIVDAMCLTVLKERGAETTEGYGDQRLWCAIGWGGMSLLTGQMIDLFGSSFIFIGWAACQCVNIAVCWVYLPAPRNSLRDRSADAAGSVWSLFFTFDMLWFFLNLFQYGTAMCLVENFLLVFLLQDFAGTTSLLLGLSIAVMCAFEIPVFRYVATLWTKYDWSLAAVILVCQLVLSLRCLLYTLLPPSAPWLVLLVEPLHGITFAAMWTATVEYGRRIAPPGAVARMQTLVNGVFYQLAFGVGSVFWGRIAERPPHGLGFRKSFMGDALFILCWCFLWQLGLRFQGPPRESGSQSGSVSLQAVTPLSEGVAPEL